MTFYFFKRITFLLFCFLEKEENIFLLFVIFKEREVKIFLSDFLGREFSQKEFSERERELKKKTFYLFILNSNNFYPKTTPPFSYLFESGRVNPLGDPNPTLTNTNYF